MPKSVAQVSKVEAELLSLAKRVLPGGGFGNVGHHTIIARGEGCRVWDVAGREYVDYLLGSGPMIAGHGHPEVLEVVHKVVAEGTTFFTNNAYGIRLAAEIVDAMACVEQVRFVSSGSEADMYAMRLMRAFKGKDKILKFEGGYHGMSDYGLISTTPKRVTNFPEGAADSAGIPAAVQQQMLVAPYNDLGIVESLIRENREELAGIIVEPFQRLIPPIPGFLEGLRELCDSYDLVLCFDEVVTGFRFAYGGAQAYYGVTPDICTMGKAIGGGFPLAAIGGRSEIMIHFDKNAVSEDDFMTQIGTLSGNPVAAAAGLKTLEILKRPGGYDHMFAQGKRLMEGYKKSINKYGVNAQVVGDAPMFDLVFNNKKVVDYRSAIGDVEMMAKYNFGMRKRGILKSEGKHYMAHAHLDEDIELTLKAFDETMAEL
jgi:glutamate-1-semialdehyde 2,1-aminomutase